MNKKLSLATTLLNSQCIFVHVNAKDLKAGLPYRLLGKDQVVLQLGYDMPIPILDLALSDVGFSGTLSFGGMPFFVNIFWDDVFAIVGDDGKGLTYPEKIPQSVLNQIKGQAKASEQPKLKNTKVPYLKVVV